MSQKDKLCADCWRKGTEAMQKQNWDYALQMFGTCVSLKPENVVYRQTLRGCTQKKYDNNKTGAGGLAKAKLMGIRSRIKKARGKEEWADMDKAAEEGLLINPWDTGLNCDVGEAAQKREFMELAEFAYKTAFEADVKNKENAIRFADILDEVGKYTDACKILEHVTKLDP
ncbi:MAG: tetratricopeptide repeat protein, partial [Planctomycetaceae bacterium]|nr:tetratricopeptide repeat protein [Planctomycetaceae bacterium]